MITTSWKSVDLDPIHVIVKHEDSILKALRDLLIEQGQSDVIIKVFCHILAMYYILRC